MSTGGLGMENQYLKAMFLSKGAELAGLAITGAASIQQTISRITER
jgi:hypothetical protein